MSKLDFLRNPDSITLKSARLAVDVALPGTRYVGSRFDHTGNIFQITLDGKHTFCGQEKRVASESHGFGLLNEFNPVHPPAYSLAKKGDYYHKIGVGDVQRDTDGPYDFFEPHPYRPAEIDVLTTASNRVEFSILSRRLHGVQYALHKTIAVEHNTLEVAYTVTNLGKSTLNLSEYCHNFLNIDGRDVDATYELIFDTKIDGSTFAKVVNPGETLKIDPEQSKISWNDTPKSDFYVESVNSNDDQCQSWTLLNHESKVGVSETLDVHCHKVNLWGVGHVISPELFVESRIRPNTQFSWTRTYEFFGI